MSLTNPLGDFEVADPQMMRALAHPVRLAVLSQLQRHGPMTATQLSERVGASPSVTSWHLRHLASFGLVTDASDPSGEVDRRRRWWRAEARGIRLVVPEKGEGREAALLLRSKVMAQALEYVARWADEVEPGLDEPWRQAAGSGNTGLRLTLAEARRLEAAIEQLLAPFAARSADDVPASARPVRSIRFLLPERPEPDKPAR